MACASCGCPGGMHMVGERGPELKVLARDKAALTFDQLSRSVTRGIFAAPYKRPLPRRIVAAFRLLAGRPAYRPRKVLT